jgi:hypothetical protein
MNRRTWWKSVVSLSLAGLSGWSVARGQVPVTLKDTLEKGLFCRRDYEFAFVDMVAEKVAQNELPLDVVLSMFQWARERRPRLPFPYFQAGLRQRAKALGVQL